MNYFLKYALISLGLGLVFTALIMIVPTLLGVTIIPLDIRSGILLYILLTSIYFILMLIIKRFGISGKKRGVIFSVSALIATVIMVGVIYFVNTFIFFQSIDANSGTNRITYAVVVRKDSSYEDIMDLNNNKIGLLDGSEELDAVEELENSLDLNFQLTVLNSGISDLANSLLEKKVEAICLEQGRLNFLYDEIDTFEQDTRVIYTFKLRNNHSSVANDSDKKTETSEPFVIYISGIDQYGQTDSVVGRSDVNQLMVVNPKTHKILLVNTPRDYYVQLAGTTGMKDKLTHAGIYGIDTSIKTIEELYGININYYVRVNFDSLIKVVDQIGGIDIVSDQAFKAYTDSSVYVQAGPNHFNGKQALAYARERYAYESGDRHRGENQQQVMMAIINKVTGSSVLLRNYNNIIQTLTGSFQTNLPIDKLTSLFGEQIENKTEWQISAISVDGTGSNQPTYSMGANLPLYVMIPNEESLSLAKTKISEVLNDR